MQVKLSGLSAVALGVLPLLLLAQTDVPVRRDARVLATERAPVARVRVEGLADQLNNVRITDLSGREVAGELDPQRDGAAVLLRARTEPLLVRMRAIQELEPVTGQKVVLPGGMIVPTRRPDGTPSDQAAWYRLTMEASPLPAPWEPGAGEYQTTLRFGLRRPPELPAELPEGQPVVVRVALDGLASTVEIEPLTLERAGLEFEKPLLLRFRVLTENPKLLIRSTFSDADLLIRAVPRIELRPQQRSVLGLGLQSVPVTVASVLAHGLPRPLNQSPLAIEVEGPARVEAAPERWPEGEAATQFALRSGGLAPVRLTATAGGLTGQAIVEQRFPTLPLIAALIGGALGGYARRFVKRARRHLTRKRVVEGLVVGLIAFVAGVLGVGYLGLPAALVATEAGAFLTGALTGFVGVTVLEKLSGGKTGVA